MGKTKLTKKTFPEVMQAIREASSEADTSDSQDAAIMVETLTEVLERLVAYGGAVEKAVVAAMDKALDDLVSEDFYGTEGQSDPRGDQRD